MGVELRPPHLLVQSTTSGQIVFSVSSVGLELEEKKRKKKTSHKKKTRAALQPPTPS